MWISKLLLENIRGFRGQHTCDFSSNINLLVGQNNAGKTTILNSILGLQRPTLNLMDISLGENSGRVMVFFQDPGSYIASVSAQAHADGVDSVLFTFPNGTAVLNNSTSNHQPTNFSTIHPNEPYNAFYPYLSKRKVTSYVEEMRAQYSRSVTGDLQNLYNKIDQISNREFQPAHDQYRAACEAILGFQISTTQSDNGKRAVYVVRNQENIPLTSMGEGVPNLLGLIVDLCVANNQIFVIEEPENDIHPKALKALLKLIASKSENNQFFISTHSNIVTKFLGSVEEARVFNVTMSLHEETKLPVSTVSEVENNPEARMLLLEDLGYEPFDFDQWKAWLFLEESSAEIIIRDFLIPTFVPKLIHRLRTYSAHSLSEVEPKFRDFNNLFVFIHLEQRYRNKAWVIIDGGEDEAEIIKKMKTMYAERGWNEGNFLQFTEHDFERFYPARFQERVGEILQIADKKNRQKNKSALLDEVKHWLVDDPDDAKTEFAESAKEVIDILKTIKKATD